MSDPNTPQQDAEPAEVPVERTNAFRAGFMNGYTADNKNSDPSVAGYMDGYFVQREGATPEPSEPAAAE